MSDKYLGAIQMNVAYKTSYLQSIIQDKTGYTR